MQRVLQVKGRHVHFNAILLGDIFVVPECVITKWSFDEVIEEMYELELETDIARKRDNFLDRCSYYTVCLSEYDKPQLVRITKVPE